MRTLRSSSAVLVTVALLVGLSGVAAGQEVGPRGCTSTLLGAEVEAIEPPEGWVLADIDALPAGWSLTFTGPAVREANDYSGYAGSLAEVNVSLICVEDGAAYMAAEERGDAWGHKQPVDVAIVGDMTHATQAVDDSHIDSLTELELQWLDGDVAGTLWMWEWIGDVPTPWADLEALARAVDAVLP